MPSSLFLIGCVIVAVSGMLTIEYFVNRLTRDDHGRRIPPVVSKGDNGNE